MQGPLHPFLWGGALVLFSSFLFTLSFNGQNLISANIYLEYGFEVAAAVSAVLHIPFYYSKQQFFILSNNLAFQYFIMFE